MTIRQVAIGDVLVNHLPKVRPFRARLDCTCGWRGSDRESWTAHASGEVDAALEDDTKEDDRGW